VGGYYELQDGESAEDFISCQCGGDLIIADNMDDYVRKSFNNHKDDRMTSNSQINKRNNRNLFFMVSGIIMVYLILNFLGIPNLMSNFESDPNNLVLASSSKGYVTKEIYSGFNTSETETKIIAVVTGIHPRENVSRKVVSSFIRQYYLSTNQMIVFYDITVNERPDDYKIGRMNGESLAASYVFPDILKSNCDLVIICHDHAPGYGEGFYIATPKMDAESVQLAEAVNQTLPEFNYYKTTANTRRGSSTSTFTKPLASAGFKTFVYEIPGLSGYSEAYNMTGKLIDTCFGLL